MELKKAELNASLDGEDLGGEDGVLEPMAHLKKKRPEFRDQDQSIAFFIENVKKLIFLRDQ